MKQFKTILALALVAVMMMALVGSALAEDGSIEINGTTADKWYSAYKIFDLTYNGSNVSYTIDSDWDNFFTAGAAGEGYIVASNTTGSLNPIVVGGTTKYINITDSNVADFATAALGYATAKTPDGRQQATSTSLTISNLALGYYLVYPEGASGIATGNGSICSLSSTKPTATVNVKAVYPTVDKNILDTNPTKTNEASIGDTVTYQITSTVPDMTGYKWYKMVFDDDLSKGLTFDAITSITIGNVTLKNSADDDYLAATHKQAFTATVGTYSETTGTNIRFKIHDLVAAGYTAGQTITITYTAKLNEHANIETANPNTVDLEYSNNPKWTKENEPGGPDWEPSEPHGETTDITTETYTASVTIHKTDGSNPLPGAAFRITGNGVNIVVTTGEKFTAVSTGGTHWLLKTGLYTTNDPNATDNEGHKLYDENLYVSTTQKYTKETVMVLDTQGSTPVYAEAYVDSTTGDLTFAGLGVGSYTITETVVPSGYNKAADVSFNVTFDKDTKAFASDNSNVTLISGKTSMFETTIVNNAGTELPSTGGIGTTIFYVAGIVMVLGAAAIIIARRKAEQE